MAINFPDSPALNEVYNDPISGFSYQWDGTIWKNFINTFSTGNLPDASVTPAKLSAGRPSWNSVGNVVILGTLSSSSSSLQIQGNTQVIGVLTATSAVVGSAVTIDSSGVNISGALTATSAIVGSAVTINSSGVNVSGILTATTAIIETELDVGIGGTVLAAFSSTGRVGLGTTNPIQPLQVGSAGTTVVVIDSLGEIGIGTTSPVSKLDLFGSYTQNVVSIAASDINCSLGNYFIDTVNGSKTYTVSSVPSNRVYSFTLEVTHTTGTITWFSNLEWPSGTAPSLTTGKTHLFMFVTDDGGSRWRGSSLINYTN